MAVVKAKPTSPGRRFRSLQTGKDLYKGRPLSSLVTKKSKTENEEIIHEEVAFVPMLPGISNGDV